MGDPLQRPLFDDNDHEREFEAFIHTPEGGQVMNLFIRLAIGAKARGVRTGAKAIWERLRWHFMLRRDPKERWKLNNNYTAYAARFAMDRAQTLRGYFELREVGR